jgi:hypothetical protein
MDSRAKRLLARWRAWRGYPALALVVLALSARATSWSMPEQRTYWSPAHSARLTVTPGAWETRAQPASGRLEVRRADGTWEAIWSKALLNEVAPVEVLVTDDGRNVVTFDDGSAPDPTPWSFTDRRAR